MIVPKKTYYSVFIILMALLGLTVAVALVDLGPLNPYIALSIALIKATLVVLYFMHVKYSTRLTWIVASAGFIWMIIFIALTLADYFSRN